MNRRNLHEEDLCNEQKTPVDSSHGDSFTNSNQQYSLSDDASIHFFPRKKKSRSESDSLSSTAPSVLNLEV